MRERKQYLADLAKEYDVDGIIISQMKFCEYWEYERGELRKLGAEVRFFPYTQQQSSTKIRAKIS